MSNAGLMAIAPLSLRKTTSAAAYRHQHPGLLYRIASAQPVFEEPQWIHSVNIAEVGGLKVFNPGGTVHSGTKLAVPAQRRTS